MHQLTSDQLQQTSRDEFECQGRISVTTRGVDLFSTLEESGGRKSSVESRGRAPRNRGILYVIFKRILCSNCNRVCHIANQKHSIKRTVVIYRKCIAITRMMHWGVMIFVWRTARHVVRKLTLTERYPINAKRTSTRLTNDYLLTTSHSKIQTLSNASQSTQHLACHTSPPASAGTSPRRYQLRPLWRTLTGAEEPEFMEVQVEIGGD